MKDIYQGSTKIAKNTILDLLMTSNDLKTEKLAVCILNESL